MEDDGGDLNILNSDELGAKGESTFETLCADAKLICNKATRDRSGWDFVVEFPIDHGKPDDLDKRDNPAFCLLQQKTLWDHNDRIKFRLSSLERLAKDPRPSFVYVLKIGEDLSAVQAFLIHMRGDVLAQILEKLRSEQASGRFAVNKATIYLYASKVGKALAPTGAALRHALTEIIGPNNAAYEREKREELRSLGYEAQPREMKMNLHVKDKEELTRVILGATKVAVSDVRTFETRFGITLETRDFPGATEMHFRPFPIDTCEVIVRRNKFTDPATFRGQVYMLPKGTGTATRIVTDMFELLFDRSQFRFTANEISGDLPTLTPSKWRSFLLLADALAVGGGSMELRPGNRLVKKIKVPLEQAHESLDGVQLAVSLEAAGRLATLLRKAGVNEEPALSYAHLLEQAPHIASASALLADDDDLMPLSFDLSEDISEYFGAELRGLHVNYVRFENDLLVWSVDAVVERSGDATAFTSKRLEFKEIQLIRPDSYKAYIEELRVSQGAEFVMSRGLEDDADPASAGNVPGEACT